MPQLRNPAEKIQTREQVAVQCRILRDAGKTVVFTNGVFDVFHAGHAAYLDEARRQGDCLVVGLNSDASVKRYKGEKRPINVEEDRAWVLAALESVDFVVVYEEDEPRVLLELFRPDVLVKGAQWAHWVAGRDIVEGYGGRIHLAGMRKDRSSTSMIERIMDVYSDGA